VSCEDPRQAQSPRFLKITQDESTKPTITTTTTKRTNEGINDKSNLTWIIL
jgi:hypothetical protein